MTDWLRLGRHALGLALHAAPRPGLALAATLPAFFREGPAALVRLHARQHPDGEAIVHGQRRMTWRELDAHVDRVARTLAARGAGTVAMVLPNGIDLVAVQLACQRIPCDLVQCPSASTEAELAQLVAASGAKVIVRAGDPLDDPGAPPLVSRRGEADVLLYTSGTTSGRPKGARRPVPRGLPLPLLDLFAQVGLARDDRHLVACPLYHAAAPLFAWTTLGVGGTIVIAEPGDDLFALMAKERITTAFMVPTQLARLQAPHRLPALRWIMSGAARLPAATAAAVEQALGPVLWNMYGATETGVVSLAAPGQHGSIGKPLVGVKIELRQGELWVKSSMTLAGYDNDAEATRQAVRDGWFSVGDLARWRPDGTLELVGRSRDLIITGGVNVYPAEIEDVLRQAPGVSDACVVGVAHERWGEAVVAFVSGAALDPQAVLQHCRSRLSPAKVPKRLLVLPRLPHSPTGKPDRRALRAMAATEIRDASG